MWSREREGVVAGKERLVVEVAVYLACWAQFTRKTGFWGAGIVERITGLILGLRPVNERRRYKVTPSLIGWAQT